MLSILIPTYNYDIREFVTELHRQATAGGRPFEIRCYDDHSDPRYCTRNRELEQMDGVVYRELPANLGRSAIRNLMAADAGFEQLLFLDCDSMPERGDFVSRYLESADAGVVYGGRSYAPEAPADGSVYFRWLYGSRREVVTADARQLQPWHAFQTNNFMMPRALFLSIRLNETLKGYGHEDTLFGLELKARNIPIRHIDNPLRHLGLESTAEFLEKTRQGIQNLSVLLRQGHDLQSVRLAAAYGKLRRWGICGLYRHWFAHNEQRLLKKLEGSDPSLRAFDLYKLGLLVTAMR